MSQSASESFLKKLADRTFLALWAIPNTFYAPGKELTDLIVPFGDDIVIISDKASRFDPGIDPSIAWRRWYARAVSGGLRQLKTAVQRIERDPRRVFLDGRASDPLVFTLDNVQLKRFHLVAVARPDPDPTIVPANWPGLRYVNDAAEEPFVIGPLSVGDRCVHVFDGPTIDLLLSTLDTAPDLIAYLSGRAARLQPARRYRFDERDLLAAALIGWDGAPAGLPSVPPLDTVVPGLWDDYVARGTLDRRQRADRPSRIIDRVIAQHDSEYAAGRTISERPAFDRHEHAMRLLAGESRFARRIIAHELHDILDEEDQSTFWAATVASPTRPELRYVWLIYPDAPPEIATTAMDLFVQEHLQQHILVAQAMFEQTLVMGIGLPNRKAADTAIFMALHDGSSWTEADRAMALSLRDDGIFGRLEEQHRVHFR